MCKIIDTIKWQISESQVLRNLTAMCCKNPNLSFYTKDSDLQLSLKVKLVSIEISIEISLVSL